MYALFITIYYFTCISKVHRRPVQGLYHLRCTVGPSQIASAASCLPSKSKSEEQYEYRPTDQGAKENDESVSVNMIA